MLAANCKIRYRKTNPSSISSIPYNNLCIISNFIKFNYYIINVTVYEKDHAVKRLSIL